MEISKSKNYLIHRNESIKNRIAERLERSAEIFNYAAKHPFSMFWHFAHQISNIVDPQARELSNLAWTNLCKIGVSRGNPDRELATMQSPLSVEILRAEIEYLKPALIVCVAAEYEDDIFYAGLNVKRGNDGFLDEASGKLSIYYRSRRDSYPPIIWMQHPQGKLRDYLADAKKIAARLISDTQ